MTPLPSRRALLRGAPTQAPAGDRPPWMPEVITRRTAPWSPPAPPVEPPTPPPPPPSSGTTRAQALHLARRATWGATPRLVADIRAVGAQAWVDAQLDPARIPLTADERTVLAEYPRLSMSVAAVRERYGSDTGDLGTDSIHAYTARAIWSERQLFEVMADFWTNHLVVTAPWGPAWDSVHRFQEDVVRRHALGRYADLLVAAVTHPALLKQLDNTSSTRWSPNENLGRELLELHTVGVEAGYTEADVRHSTLVLTGLTTHRTTGEAAYEPDWHHTGRLTVLDWTHANTAADGSAVVRDYLLHLARHPRTARRIATKLAVRFVGDTPPAALVDRLAAAYLAADTRTAPVLRTLFASEEFAGAGGTKTKRPFENAVSTARVLGIRPGPANRRWFDEVLWLSSLAGHKPMGWPAPNGYPDVAAAWAGAGATLGVWNLHMQQGWQSTRTDDPWVTVPPFRGLLPAALPATHGEYVDALASRLLVGPLSTAKRAAVCAFLDRTPASPLRATDAAVGWRLPYVVALLLDTPEFATR